MVYITVQQKSFHSQSIFIDDLTDTSIQLISQQLDYSKRMQTGVANCKIVFSGGGEFHFRLLHKNDC